MDPLLQFYLTLARVQFLEYMAYTVLTAYAN